MVSLVNSHTNASRIGWHLWEIDLRFAPGLPPGGRGKVPEDGVVSIHVVARDGGDAAHVADRGSAVVPASGLVFEAHALLYHFAKVR